MSAAKVSIVIRYDDFLIPDLKGRTLEEVRAVEFALAEFHAGCQLPAVLAVVPVELDSAEPPQKVIGAMLRACEAGSELALHGYDHANTLPPTSVPLLKTWRRFCQRTKGEFAHLSLEEQTRRIVAGKRALESRFLCPVRTFVPPWNAYDANTIAACRTAGLTALSASRSWPVPPAHDMTLLPQTTGEEGLERAVDHALSARDRSVIVCVVHIFDFDALEGGPRIPVSRWAARLQALRERPGVAFTTIAALDSLFRAQLGAARLRRHRRFSALWRLAALLRCVRAQDPRRAVYALK